MDNGATFLFWIKILFWTIQALLDAFNHNGGDISSSGEEIAGRVIRSAHADLSESSVNKVKTAQVKAVDRPSSKKAVKV